MSYITIRNGWIIECCMSGFRVNKGNQTYITGSADDVVRITGK